MVKELLLYTRATVRRDIVDALILGARSEEPIADDFLDPCIIGRDLNAAAPSYQDV